jgi:hypothetical protein
MADNLRGDAHELSGFAGTVLGVGDGLTDTAASAAPNLAVPATTFGNVTESATLHQAHTAAADAVVTMLGVLAEVAENDADWLYGAAFAVQRQIQSAAAQAGQIIEPT